MILTEMARIASHLVFMSSYPLELGAPTPLMHALRERERVLDLIEGVTGGRFHPNFNRVGGVKPAAGGGSEQKKVSQDLPQGFLQATRDAMDDVLAVCDDLEELVTGNELIQARTIGVGVIPGDVALSYGMSGGNLRASGIGFDLRKHENVLPYDEMDFEVPIGVNGDCYDRYVVRLLEIRQAARIVQQAVDGIPSGPLQAKVPRILKVPTGETYVRAENPKGEMGYYIVSQGGRTPIPGEDQVGVVLQPLGAALGARRRPGPRPGGDHGQPRLRPGRRRPVNFWLELVLKVALILAVVLPGALVVIFGELKISAHMQSRIGPYFAGGRYGWAQPLADGLKFMQKEDLVPAAADSAVFRLAPYVVLMGTLAVFVIVPFGPDLVAEDLDLGLFYLLAVSSLTTLGVLMAGWSSGNKYSMIGGLRAAAQLIAYELPLVLAAVAVAVQAGTMSLGGIVDAQAEPVFTIGSFDVSLPFVLKGQIIGFLIFVTASLAELSRIPFDMPIAESELTMGYLTEYSGLRFTMFFLGEYAGMVAIAAIVATIFLGGYWLPGVPEDTLNFVGPLVLVTKVALLCFLFIWIRWTFPRFREDQLQTLAWKWLIPAALVNIVLTGFAKVVL